MKSGNSRILLFPILACLLLQLKFCYGQEEKKIPWLEFNGYLKDLQSLSMADRPDSLYSSTLLHNRLKLKLNFTSRLSARIEMRNRVFLGDQLRQVPFFSRMLKRSDELLKLDFLWLDRTRIVGHTDFDRAYIQFANQKIDIRLGAQRINWGMATVWNPNDIFNAYNFLDFDYEERPGRQAIRVQYFGSQGSSIDLAWKPGKDRNNHTGAVLYKFNKSRYDYQMLAGVVQKDYVAGGGWAGNIRNAGFKGELSYFHPMRRSADTTGKLVTTLMADYSTKNNWYLSISLLLNLSQEKEGLMLFLPLNSDLSAKDLSPYKFNLYVGAIKPFTPIVTGNFSLFYAPHDQTLILFPSLSINISEDLDLDFIVQSFFAAYPSVYKLQGGAAYFRLKWSFGHSC